jgi:hypothetical protein
MATPPLPSLSSSPLHNRNHLFGCRPLYFSVHHGSASALRLERVSAPPTPAISLTAQRLTPQVSGVKRDASPLVTLAIVTAATMLSEEGPIVFGASFSLRKQKRVKMNLKRVVCLFRVSLG